MIIRRRVLVEGRVQGVGFRASTQAKARAIDPTLTGYVRNLSDGRVEALVEGEERSVLELARWCGRGPTSARVRRLEVIELPAGGDLPPFEVRAG